jgi:hypothetical protein
MTEFIAEDPAITVTVEHVEQAKEILIQRQDTHLDSLAERLRENRVKAISEVETRFWLVGDIRSPRQCTGIRRAIENRNSDNSNGARDYSDSCVRDGMASKA